VGSTRQGQPGPGVELPDGSWWDWDVVAWGAGQLRLGAGADLTYHHELEVVFHCPLLVRCPAEFQDPVFRAPTADETLSVTRQTGETPGIVVAFEADAGGPEPASCLIAAERVEIIRGTVFRYWRESLEPGQRLAPWVQPPVR
jgi:hypothetical protein